MPVEPDREHLTCTLIDASFAFDLLKKQGIKSSDLAVRWQTTVTTVNRYHAATRAMPAWIVLDLWDLVKATVPGKYRPDFCRAITLVKRFYPPTETPRKFVNRIKKKRRKNDRTSKETGTATG